MYDIIGDVHGHAQALKALLCLLDYETDAQGVWRHPERRLIFVGDLIDRGPQHLELLEMVRAMVDAGVARVIMGNHELNAIAYATPDPRKAGEYLRPHTDGRKDQHIAYLNEVGEGTEEHRQHIEWFKTFPLWIEEPGFKVIHACWHPETITRLQPYLNQDATFSSALLEHPTMMGLYDVGTTLFEDVERILKGIEVTLPNGITFTTGHKSPDADPTRLVRRTETRVKWWETGFKTWSDAVLIPKMPDELKTLALDEQTQAQMYYYHQETPVFFGHYWMHGTPKVFSPHAICVDWSIGIENDHQGVLAAYRWTAGKTICDDGFKFVRKTDVYHP